MSYPERRPGRPRLIRTDVAVLYLGDEAEKQALLLGEPEVLFTIAGYDGLPLVLLRLGAVDTERLAELVVDSWRMRSPAGSGSDKQRPQPNRVPELGACTDDGRV